MESNARVEVLVAAVDSCPNIFDAINVHELGIVANQISSRDASRKDNKRTAIVSTKTRGVGINRNIALLHASEKIVLFGDDDMRYSNDFEEVILKAFEAIPSADMVIFNLKYKNSPVENNRRVIKKIGRVRIWNALNYGAPRMAMRLSSQKRANIWFNTLFGGGSMYGAGEDCLFLLDALRNGLKVYTYPAYIAETDLSGSSWFRGYTEKFFFDKGALFKAAFPKLSIFMILQFSFRHRNIVKEQGFIRSTKLMIKGAKFYKKNLDYEDFHGLS